MNTNNHSGRNERNDVERSREPSRVCGSVDPIEHPPAAGPQGSPPPEGTTEPREHADCTECGGTGTLYLADVDGWHPEPCDACTPAAADRPIEPRCGHTEHATRGDGRYGRHFETADPAGTWEPCPSPPQPAAEDGAVEGRAVCSECEPSLSDRPAPVVPDSTGAGDEKVVDLHGSTVTGTFIPAPGVSAVKNGRFVPPTPDSTALRERARAALTAAWDKWFTETSGGGSITPDLIARLADAVLAVVGQGVTAEAEVRPCAFCGRRVGPPPKYGYRVHASTCRAVVRSGEQGGE